MDKRFLVIVVIILGVFGFLLMGGDKAKTPGATDQTKVTQHSVGAGNKKVEIIEYGDFQCPFCGQFYPIIEQVKQKYGDDITFTFKNFPLESLHQNARAAHRAAEAASLQGKFWEMYNALYSRQSEWSTATNPISVFENYAKELALNIDTYKKDYASSAVNDAINADQASGQKLKITGTPTFVINGKTIELPNRSVEAFSTIVDKAIADANPSPSTTPTTTPTQ